MVMGALARQHPVPPDTPSSVPTPQNLPCLMPPHDTVPLWSLPFPPSLSQCRRWPPSPRNGECFVRQLHNVLYWAELPPEPPFSHRYGSGPARPPPPPSSSVRKSAERVLGDYKLSRKRPVVGAVAPVGARSVGQRLLADVEALEGAGDVVPLARDPKVGAVLAAAVVGFSLLPEPGGEGGELEEGGWG